jgi:hypothetical protein
VVPRKSDRWLPMRTKARSEIELPRWAKSTTE